MAINRRNFVKSTAVAASVPLLSSPLKAASHFNNKIQEEKASEISYEHAVLNKLTYGATQEEIVIFKKKGLEKYLKEQLKPDDSKDCLLYTSDAADD